MSGRGLIITKFNITTKLFNFIDKKPEVIHKFIATSVHNNNMSCKYKTICISFKSLTYYLHSVSRILLKQSAKFLIKNFL